MLIAVAFADFAQTVMSANGSNVQQGNGKLQIKRPNLFRMDTKSPQETQIIADGQTLWFYDPFVEQVTANWVKDAVNNTPFVLLTSNDKSHWAQYSVEQKDDRFVLKPKAKNSNIKQFDIRIDQNGVLKGFSTIEKDGQSNQYILRNITNQNLDGLMLIEVPGFSDEEVVCSRLKREDMEIVPKASTEIRTNDILQLVGDDAALSKMRLIIGHEVDAPTSSYSGEIRAERVVVTNEKVLGKKIRTLGIHQKYGVVISRLNRAGIELVPTANTTLQFGDVLHMVGHTDVLNKAISVIGNAQQKLLQVQMLPVFIGIGLGVLVGSIPFYIPGFPVALKLGLAGGPLVVALILARIGTIGKLYWFMPPSANLALREIGIVLFLAVVGLKSGGSFFDTLLNGSGLEWMGYGIFITFIPLMITGILARLYGKLNYLTICGLLAGSMTDPPALAFANEIKEDNGAAALSYATVYPLVMFLRIMSPQLLAVLLWAA